MSSVSVLVPTVNEIGNIDALLDRIHASIPYEHEVIVIDGSSDDGTPERVLERGDASLVRQSGRKGGLTGAILQGAAEAKHDIVVVIDADLSHPPEVIPKLVAPIEAGEKDMVVGSRKAPGGDAPGWPMRRKFTSWVASMMAWPLTDVRDPMAGYFATTKRRLLDVDPDAGGFKVGLEVLTQDDGGVRTGEVPIIFHDREAGVSKLGSKVIRAYLERLFALAGGRGLPVLVPLVALVLDIGLWKVLGLAGVVYPAMWSGLLSCGVAYALLLRGASDEMRAGRRLPRGITMSIFCVFLRAPIVLSPLGIVGGALFSVALFSAACMFYVFPRPQAENLYRLRWRVAAVGLTGYTFLLRTLYMGVVDLIPEEAYYWNYGQHLAAGYLDHPPMVGWLIALSTAVFGDNMFAVRLPAVLCGVIVAIYAYRLAHEMFDKTAGILALMLVSTLLFFLGNSFIMTPDAPLAAAWAAALFYLFRVFQKDDVKGWWGAGLAIGLGLLSKYSITVLGPAIVILMLFERKWWRRWEPYAAGVLAFAVFSPVIYWNATRGWQSFAFQSTRRIAEAAKFSLPSLLVASLVMLTPMGVWAAARGLKKHRFLAVLTIWPFLVFAVFSLRSATKMNWTGPIWLAVVPLLAVSIVSSVRASRLWGATVSVSVGLVVVFLHFAYIGLPYVTPKNFRIPIGWTEMSAVVREVESELDDPIIVGMNRYFIASQLAFFGHNTTSRQLVGRPSLMYEYWDPAEKFYGRTALFVGRIEAEVSDEWLAPYVESLEPARMHEVWRHGRRVGHFFTRVGRSLRPAP